MSAVGVSRISVGLFFVVELPSLVPARSSKQTPQGACVPGDFGVQGFGLWGL